MAQIKAFLAATRRIRQLDFDGVALDADIMAFEFRRRNSFGLAPETKIGRIWRRDFLENDIAQNCLTLPKAGRIAWNDPLENPLASVSGPDDVTGLTIDYGAIVRSYHAQCWTRRSRPRANDWKRFAPDNEAVWVSTTVSKLLTRLMLPSDDAYMHRTWLVEACYLSPERIRAMMNPDGVLNRLDPSGALLAISAATIRGSNIDEEEIRLLYDASLKPRPNGVLEVSNTDLIRIPFDWTDFLEEREPDPRFP